MADTDKSYARDEAFWKKYLKGRPQVPDSLFERVCNYHAGHGGLFNAVHDVGAGVGVHSERLAKHFGHVIISDVAPGNVELAKGRLGTGKYSYKVMSVDDADVIEESSVDMVFASTMMHFADFDKALPAIAKQLKSGGSFVVMTCGVPVFINKDVEDVWYRMWHEGLRVLLRQAGDPRKRLETLSKSGSSYDNMPLSEEYFLPGSFRIMLNYNGRWPKFLPDDIKKRIDTEPDPQSAIGPSEKLSAEDEPGWGFRSDIDGLRDQWDTFPFAGQEPEAFVSMWKELEALVPPGKILEGVFPARVILATKR